MQDIEHVSTAKSTAQNHSASLLRGLIADTIYSPKQILAMSRTRTSTVPTSTALSIPFML
jgi:hypothetical protein